MSQPELELCFSAELIKVRIAQMASEIDAWYRSGELNPIPVLSPVMNGAIFFFADLARALSDDYLFAPIKSKAYQPETDKLLSGEVVVDLGEGDFIGKRVLVIDDICDSGSTLTAIKTKLMSLGVVEVRSAGLI